MPRSVQGHLAHKKHPHLQVSSTSDYFPGTECRVVAISGAMPTVAQAASAILQEVFQDAERLNAQVPTPAHPHTHTPTHPTP